jgi:hypothetical protein
MKSKVIPMVKGNAMDFSFLFLKALSCNSRSLNVVRYLVHFQLLVLPRQCSCGGRRRDLHRDI